MDEWRCVGGNTSSPLRGPGNAGCLILRGEKAKRETLFGETSNITDGFNRQILT